MSARKKPSKFTGRGNVMGTDKKCSQELRPGGQGGAGPLKLGGVVVVVGMGLCQAEGQLGQPCEGSTDRGGLDSLCCLPGEKGWVGMGRSLSEVALELAPEGFLGCGQGRTGHLLLLGGTAEARP